MKYNTGMKYVGWMKTHVSILNFVHSVEYILTKAIMKLADVQILVFGFFIQDKKYNVRFYEC